MELCDTHLQVVLASGVTLIAGIWLIIAPFELGFTSYRDAEWDSIVVGVAVAIVAATRIWGGRDVRCLSWVNVVLGLWIIVSPWVFGNGGVRDILLSDVIAGIVVVVFARGAR